MIWRIYGEHYTRVKKHLPGIQILNPSYNADLISLLPQQISKAELQNVRLYPDFVVTILECASN